MLASRRANVSDAGPTRNQRCGVRLYSDISLGCFSLFASHQLDVSHPAPSNYIETCNRALRPLSTGDEFIQAYGWILYQAWINVAVTLLSIFIIILFTGTITRV